MDVEGELGFDVGDGGKSGRRNAGHDLQWASKEKAGVVAAVRANVTTGCDRVRSSTVPLVLGTASCDKAGKARWMQCVYGLAGSCLSRPVKAGVLFVAARQAC